MSGPRVKLWAGLVVVAVSGAAVADPAVVPLEALLGPETVAPAPARVVALKPQADAPADLSPEALSRDPQAIVRFVESDPKRLDVQRMDPDLVLTLVQMLLRADRTFTAEKLLYDALERWPDNLDLVRGYARVVISLGRPRAAITRLTPAVTKVPGDPMLRYLLGRAHLGVEPPTPANDAAAKAAFEAALEIDPAYRDPEGVGPEDLRAIITRLGQGRAVAP